MFILIFKNILASISILLQHQNMQPVDKNFWFYFIYAVSILIVLLITILTIKYLINPKERSENHIKRIILNDREENKK
ncbi:MAG: hypothetical protein IT276_07725 [Ignavibacteriaceae bacterium]|nr:hypothetical protein [Ignavibacterium sp.]MCC6254786.1 hypothetical protein [Ignavibacteriaceae bacterium]HRN26422.1 hypothetical protein [Ignavibacteriaceae bacterium]HRP92687.1 hypothetical protein [Ignavibacteriaceae bacterium]HRQ54055.1 hypothetical protein [Ignavibacteriaceae bacterium]